MAKTGLSLSISSDTITVVQKYNIMEISETGRDVGNKLGWQIHDVVSYLTIIIQLFCVLVILRIEIKLYFEVIFV